MPLAVLPLGLSLLLLLVGLIARWRWPVITAVLLLWFFSLGFVSQMLWRCLESPWQRRRVEAVSNVDAIVVLSGGLHPALGSARFSEWQDPDRFLAGLELYRAGKAPLLFFTGGTSPFRPGQPLEGHLYRKEAERQGISSDSIVVTSAVVNTAEEASQIRNLFEANESSTPTFHANSAPPKILLVTSAFHMKRAQRVFQRQGLGVQPFPVDFQSRAGWAGPLWRDPTQWFPSAHALDESSRALRELLGRLVYRVW
ncbi:YdcF family protein [Synechococcus sp. UW105]|uniref:YdcF family protein n=1 Tax=Synechococcus sp. UW105 TaxID=337067 RepID=UPI001FCAA960|nr:YdcF family protein [Synechococcus sp. UW105]